MKKIHFLIGIYFVLFAQIRLHGQVDTSLLIQEIEISESSIRGKNIGGKKDQIYQGNLPITTDLTSLLNLAGGLYIKSYGSNSLGTSSIRGGSAGHTLLLWNGVPLQSPTLGLLDFSLIPIQSLESIDVQKGGNSALWGSGAIGGVINLENKLDTKTFAKGHVQVGSFGNLTTGLTLGYGDKGYYGKTKISRTVAENNFPYEVAPSSPSIELTNAAFNTLNINQDVYFTINEKQYINAHYWWQKSKKEIPPTLTQNFNESYQEDEANRLLIDWNRVSDNHKTKVKLAVLDELQQFVDPIINLVSINEFTQWFGEIGHSISYKQNQEFNFGVTLVETGAKTNGFDSRIAETKVGFWLSYQLRLKQLTVLASLREELVDGLWIPLTPSVGVEYDINLNLKLRSKISRNYRLATLNDKHWMPGGNENLLPESGWSEELGIKYQKQLAQNNFTFELTGFNRNIKNWIIWSPSDEFNFWTAKNLRDVWSRGLEASVKYHITKGNSKLELSTNYNFIKSTNQVTLSLPKIEKGEQLIYTPVHQVSAQIGYAYNKLMLNYQHLFTGVNQGINEVIPSYHLGNVRGSYVMKLKNTHLNYFVQIQNVWNKNYVVIERRPMPGINFQLGINFTLYKQK